MPQADDRDAEQLYNEWRRQLEERHRMEVEQRHQQIANANAAAAHAEYWYAANQGGVQAAQAGVAPAPQPIPPVPENLRGLAHVYFNGAQWVQVAGMGDAPAGERPADPNVVFVGENAGADQAYPAPRRREIHRREMHARIPINRWEQYFGDRPPQPERAEPKEVVMPKQPDAKPLNIDKYLDTVQNRIYRVGIELEGGWVNVPPGMNVVRDGSVKDLLPGPGQPLAAVGEIPSYAMEPVKIRPWMKKYYPQVVNHTCGLHVHMSFMSALHYEWLIAPEYQETVLEYLKRFGEREGIAKNSSFWKRVGGEHEHCIKLYWPDRQIAVERKHFDNDHGRGMVGNRYTAINYCWGQHNTLECRVLPMFKDPEMGIKAVLEVLRITNACLVALARVEKPVKADYFVEDDSIYQDHRKELV